MLVITTARKPSRAIEIMAQDLGRRYNIPYIVRGNQRLDSMIEEHLTVLVLSRERLSCHTRAGEFFLHPNMAAVRIKLLRQGKEDAMLRVMGIQPGDSVLDCTAGLCADSLVAKFGVGAGGKVVALEKSLPVYIAVKYGLEQYTGPERFRDLAAGIELIHADYRTTWRRCREGPLISFTLIPCSTTPSWRLPLCCPCGPGLASAPDQGRYRLGRPGGSPPGGGQNVPSLTFPNWAETGLRAESAGWLWGYGCRGG